MPFVEMLLTTRDGSLILATQEVNRAETFASANGCGLNQVAVGVQIWRDNSAGSCE
jgi:hypothetical protein